MNGISAAAHAGGFGIGLLAGLFYSPVVDSR